MCYLASGDTLRQCHPAAEKDGKESPQDLVPFQGRRQSWEAGATSLWSGKRLPPHLPLPSCWGPVQLMSYPDCPEPFFLFPQHSVASRKLSLLVGCLSRKVLLSFRDISCYFQEVLVPRQPSDFPLRHLTGGFAYLFPLLTCLSVPPT